MEELFVVPFFAHAPSALFLFVCADVGSEDFEDADLVFAFAPGSFAVALLPPRPPEAGLPAVPSSLPAAAAAAVEDLLEDATAGAAALFALHEELDVVPGAPPPHVEDPLLPVGLVRGRFFSLFWT